MEMYLRELAIALATEGHDVRVVTRFARDRPVDVKAMHGGAEPPRHYDDGGVRVHVVAPGRARAAFLKPVYRLHYRAPALAVRLTEFALGRSMRKALRGCDVIHFSGSGRELLGFVARRIAASMDVPFVVTPHTHQGVWGDGEIDLRLYRQAARVIALTHDEAGRLRHAGVGPDAIEVIGHGVSVRGGGDGSAFRDRHGLGSAPLVLFLGRKTADKGYDLLLEAAFELWSQVPDARIVLAGTPGAPRPVPPSMDDPRVVDLGHIDDREREDAYAACDVFCLPSEAEAFGLVILEAWSYGKPVVVSDIPTLVERVGGGGGLVVPRDAGQIAGALARLLTNEVLRRNQGDLGRSVAERSTWQRAARSMAALYMEAVAHHRRLNGPRIGG